jgi:shikimate kinase
MQKVREKLGKPIVLVGLMGAGKSTVGRRLARRLQLPFVDSDSEIEDAVGLSAGELFERYGEEEYREGERRLVARLIDGGEVRVIATGGGVFVDPLTRKLLKERGLTVWLDAPVDVLVHRTSRRDTRPLLKTPDPKGTFEKLAAIERAAYAEADIHVRSGGGAHGDVVDSIIQELEQFLDRQA